MASVSHKVNAKLNFLADAGNQYNKTEVLRLKNGISWKPTNPPLQFDWRILRCLQIFAENTKRDVSHKGSG